MMSFLISFYLQWFAILWPWDILNPNTQLGPSLMQKPCIDDIDEPETDVGLVVGREGPRHPLLAVADPICICG